MAERESRRIASERMSEPHIVGRRVSVRQIQALVEVRGKSPAAVADRFDLDLADVYRALAYYHDHREQMRAIENEREDVIAEIEDEFDRPADVDSELA